MPIKLFVFIITNFTSGTGPKCLCIINRFPFRDISNRFFFTCFIGFTTGHWGHVWLQHFHRNGDMIRILLNDATQAPVIGKFRLVCFQMHSDCCAALFPLDLFDLIICFTFTGPANCICCFTPCPAGFNNHFFGNDK